MKGTGLFVIGSQCRAQFRKYVDVNPVIFDTVNLPCESAVFETLDSEVFTKLLEKDRIRIVNSNVFYGNYLAHAQHILGRIYKSRLYLFQQPDFQ